MEVITNYNLSVPIVAILGIFCNYFKSTNNYIEEKYNRTAVIGCLVILILWIIENIIIH